MNLTDYIKDIPDFPKKGILFRDISPLLKSPEGWSKVMTQLGLLCEELTPDLIVGIESRWFIVGSALATSQNLGFVPIRKKGKLPGNLLGVDYTLEYGKDRLEIQSDALQGNPRVLLIDDLLATGGTVNAASELIKKAGGQLVGCGFIIELNELNGRENVPNVPVRSLIRYDWRRVRKREMDWWWVHDDQSVLLFQISLSKYAFLSTRWKWKYLRIQDGFNLSVYWETTRLWVLN